MENTYHVTVRRERGFEFVAEFDDAPESQQSISTNLPRLAPITHRMRRLLWAPLLAIVWRRA